MLLDLTLPITQDMAARAQQNEPKALVGHLGTHIDTMGKTFPLEQLIQSGILIDVSSAGDEITSNDLGEALTQVRYGDVIILYTGFIQRVPYGSEQYFKQHPQLSRELIDLIAENDNITAVAVDFAGLRRGKEHTPTDQYLADHGAFVIENCFIDPVKMGECFEVYDFSRRHRYIEGDVHVFPMSYIGTSGVPCRIVFDSEDGYED